MDWTSLAQQASANTGGIVPANLVLSVIAHESSGNPNAVSYAANGTPAQGLMQLQPATAQEVGVSNPFDPAQNINGGTSYLSKLYQRFGNWTQALSAYNTGYANSPTGAAYAAAVLAGAGLSSATPDASTGTPSPITPASVSTTGQQSVGQSLLAGATTAGAAGGKGVLFYGLAIVLIVALVAFGVWGVIREG